VIEALPLRPSCSFPSSGTRPSLDCLSQVLALTTQNYYHTHRAASSTRAAGSPLSESLREANALMYFVPTLAYLAPYVPTTVTLSNHTTLRGERHASTKAVKIFIVVSFVLSYELSTYVYGALHRGYSGFQVSKHTADVLFPLRFHCRRCPTKPILPVPIKHVH